MNDNNFAVIDLEFAWQAVKAVMAIETPCEWSKQVVVMSRSQPSRLTWLKGCTSWYEVRNDGAGGIHCEEISAKEINRSSSQYLVAVQRCHKDWANIVVVVKYP